MKTCYRYRDSLGRFSRVPIAPTSYSGLLEFILAMFVTLSCLAVSVGGY